MVKRFVILRRKPGMSRQQFRDHWRNVHGPLIAKLPGLIKYVQYHVRSELLDEEDDPIDGIAELWFASEEAQKQAYATPEYEAVVRDEPHLFEMSGHHIHPVMTEETVTIVDVSDARG